VSFPLAKPLQNTLKASSNAFVTELNATGSGLVFSTYLGGSGQTGVAGFKVDNWGVARDDPQLDSNTTWW
jgi:hypothetical protein